MYRNKNRLNRHPRHPPPPPPYFHKRRVQVHSKSINLLRLHSSSKESTNTLFWQNQLDPVWPVWLQLKDANWNRLFLKWDRTLVEWYQSDAMLPSALNTFYQVPRRNKTWPRTHSRGQLVLLPVSEDTVARRNRKKLDYWCFSTRFQRAEGGFDTQCRRRKLRLQAGVLTSRHVRCLHTNLWPFHSTGVCRGKFWSLSCSWWPGLAESQIILGLDFCTFTKLKRQKVTGPTEKMCKLDLLHQLFSWHTSSLWIISWLKSGAGRRWSQALKYNVRLFTGACFSLWNLAALPEGLAIPFTAQAGETGARVGMQVSASPVWWRLTWRSRSTAGFYPAIMVPIILQWRFRAATLSEYRVSPTKKLTHSGASSGSSEWSCTEPGPPVPPVHPSSPDNTTYLWL